MHTNVLSDDSEYNRNELWSIFPANEREWELEGEMTINDLIKTLNEKILENAGRK